MAETLHISAGSKAERYQSLLPQLAALIATEKDVVATLANVSAALKSSFDWLWVGFYLVRGQELVLGPFQGPIACTRIAYGRGVCGSAWQNAQTLVVADVDAFPGHIACSSQARSEIVVPLFSRQGEVVAVLDVDASALAAFDDIDRAALEELATQLTPLFG